MFAYNLIPKVITKNIGPLIQKFLKIRIGKFTIQDVLLSKIWLGLLLLYFIYIITNAAYNHFVEADDVCPQICKAQWGPFNNKKWKEKCNHDKCSKCGTCRRTLQGPYWKP